jgi:hypothetical protein
MFCNLLECLHSQAFVKRFRLCTSVHNIDSNDCYSLLFKLVSCNYIVSLSLSCTRHDLYKLVNTREQFNRWEHFLPLRLPFHSTWRQYFRTRWQRVDTMFYMFSITSLRCFTSLPAKRRSTACVVLHTLHFLSSSQLHTLFTSSLHHSFLPSSPFLDRKCEFDWAGFVSSSAAVVTIYLLLYRELETSTSLARHNLARL